MKKILSAALALVCIWFATPSFANCNLWNLNEITHKDVTNYVVNETGFSGTGNPSATAFVSTNQTFPAGTYTFSFTVTPTTSTYFIFGASDLSKIYINGINNFTENSGITAYFHTAHGSYITTGTKVKIKSSVPFKIGFALAGVTYTYSDIQLERGDTATAYTPYNPLCATCDGTVVNYVSATGTVSQSGTPTPENPIEPTFYKQGNMVLRKVGDYADSYDASTGKITRRIGVKVLDGTETWVLYGTRYVSNTIDGTAKQDIKIISSHFENGSGIRLASGMSRLEIFQTAVPDLSTAEQLKNWLAQQYAAGTPVMLYYPLATETTEDWTETSYCSAPIKIATTKYNETAFSPLNTALQNAISVVDTVVTQTITQAASIATLQAQKQTRPNDIADDNEKCPAGKKCLLVEDASGIPHWYEIVENASLLPSGYTQLEYIESTGTQYIDTGIESSADNRTSVSFDFALTNANNGENQAFGANLNLNMYNTPTSLYFRSASRTIAVLDTNKHSINLYFDASGNRVINFDGSVYTGTPASNSINIYLFAMNAGGTTSWKALYKLYYTKIYNNGILVRDFVPAKNADGKIGMYDLANGVFYENAGTGEFIAGPVAE